MKSSIWTFAVTMVLLGLMVALMAFPSASAFMAISAMVPILIGALAIRVLTDKDPQGIREKHGEADWYR